MQPPHSLRGVAVTRGDDLQLRLDGTIGSLSPRESDLRADCVAIRLRADQVEAAWSAVMPILDYWGAHAPKEFPNYAAGSWGPAEADELMRRDGRAWRVME